MKDKEHKNRDVETDMDNEESTNPYYWYIDESGQAKLGRTENNPVIRKSLSVDINTYNLLKEICDSQRRSIKNQLQIIIEYAHHACFDYKTVDDDSNYSKRKTN